MKLIRQVSVLDGYLDTDEEAARGKRKREARGAGVGHHVLRVGTSKPSSVEWLS